MEFNYKSYKKSFVDFFSEQGYKTYISREDKKMVFMYSSKKEISVIKIYDSYANRKAEDLELEHLKKKLSSIKDVQTNEIKVISIYLDKEHENFVIQEDNEVTVISCDLKFLKYELGKYFKDISNLVIEENNNEKISYSDKKDSINDMSDVQTPQDLEKKLNMFSSRMKNSTHFGSMIFVLLLMVVPLIGEVIQLIMGTTSTSNEVSKLFQGGTTYTLTMIGGQVWRMFSYGMSTPSSNFIIAIIIILVAGWAMYKMMKMNEFIMKTWKFMLAFIISYIIFGFFASVLIPNYVTGGIMPMLALSTGMLALSVSGEKNLVSSFSKMKLIWPIILLVIFPIFTGGGMEYLGVVTAFCIGGSMGFMFTYDYKELNWRIALPIIILLITILMPGIMMAIPQYVPGVDGNIVNTLALYIHKHLMSLEQANKIINNIGWDDIKLEQIGDIILIPHF